MLRIPCVLAFAWFSFTTVIADANDRSQKKPVPRTDLYGDPLPDGVVARLGSSRLRHAGLSDFVFLPGGKSVLSAGSDRVLRFWNLTSGLQVRAVRLQG